MKEYNFDFNFSTQKPSVVIARYGVRFNKTVLMALHDTERVMIGYDSRNNALCIAEWNGDSGVKNYKVVRDTKGWGRIGSKGLSREMSEIARFDFLKRTQAFDGIIDQDKHMVIFDLGRGRNVKERINKKEMEA